MPQPLSAVYVTSAPSLAICPAPEYPEFAFIGRSNVGKSSLINLLANNKNLALTSNKPGKTKAMNYFLFQNSWYLVDLPGYGYAKTSKAVREVWDNNLVEYLLQRETLQTLFILVDAAIPPQKADLEFITWVAINDIPFQLVFTKTDKAKQTEIHRHLTDFEAALHNLSIPIPKCFKVSNLKKTGAEAILESIQQSHS